MVQATTWGVPRSGPATPTSMAERIDDSLDALLSLHAGATAPSYAVEGTLWADTSVVDEISIKIYDGSDWSILDAATLGGIAASNYATKEYASLLSGFKNKIINGNMAIAQRGTSGFTSSGYTLDRWALTLGTGASCTISRGAMSVGAISTHMLVWDRSVAGTADSVLLQKIEDVETLHGTVVTLTFHAYASAATELEAYLAQNFGTGGSPSTQVATTVQSVNLTTSLQKFSLTFSLPSISGKTLGTNLNDFLGVAFQRPFDATNPTALVYITHVSLVSGDATGETDPFSPRHPQQELALCQRYYERVALNAASGAANGVSLVTSANFCVSKRTTPTVTLIQNNLFYSAVNVSAVSAYFTLTNGIVAYRTMGAAGPGSQFSELVGADSEL